MDKERERQVTPAASWFKKVRGRKFQSSDRQLQISDRCYHAWVLTISILPINSVKMGIFSPKFCILGKKFQTGYNNLGEGQLRRRRWSPHRHS